MPFMVIYVDHYIIDKIIRSEQMQRLIIIK